MTRGYRLGRGGWRRLARLTRPRRSWPVAIAASAASLYVGDTTSFFAADGGVALVGAVALLIWMSALSVSTLRRRRSR